MNHDAPPTNPPPARAPAATPRKQPIASPSVPRDGGTSIDIDPRGGVAVRVDYHYNRPWGLVIGFGILALVATASILYDVLSYGRLTLGPGFVAGTVFVAVLALAAAFLGGVPPLHVTADARELRVRGGPLNEKLQWRRDQVLAVSAEDLDAPGGQAPRVSVVIEIRDDEYVTFRVATKQEQAAIVEALRGALKLD